MPNVFKVLNLTRFQVILGLPQFLFLAKLKSSSLLNEFAFSACPFFLHTHTHPAWFLCMLSCAKHWENR